MNTNTDKPIRLTQLVTVVYETSYTREEALELLKKSGSPMAHVPGELTIQKLAESLAAAANNPSLSGYDELYPQLTDDAGDWVDTADIGDWEVSR
jgi:hypothetical protein